MGHVKGALTIVYNAPRLRERHHPPLVILHATSHAPVLVQLEGALVATDNLGDLPGQPGLVDMTPSALDVLGQNENGFYVMVESASVDKQMHPPDQERMIADLVEFDNALDAIEWAATSAPETLIVVTADHGHCYEVCGTVGVESFNAAEDDAGRRNAIQIYGDAGLPTCEDADGDLCPDSWAVSVTLAGVVNNHPDYSIASMWWRSPSLHDRGNDRRRCEMASCCRSVRENRPPPFRGDMHTVCRCALGWLPAARI